MNKLNKEDQNSLDREILSFGYKTYDTDFFDSTEYKNLLNAMITNLPKFNDDKITFNCCTKDELLASAKYVIDLHTVGTDTRVRYVDSDSLTAELYCLFGDEPDESKYDEIAQYIDNHTELITVTKVPVELKIFKDRNGREHNTWFYYQECMKNDFYQKIKPAVQKIIIEGGCNDDSICIYIHEMYHALAVSHKGCIENYLNDEVLSIYMERLGAADLDPTKELEELEILTRLKTTKHNMINRMIFDYNEINPLDKLDNEKYIQSTAVATALYNTYKYGSNNIKQEIDDSINGIFREEHTLEDVLQKYDATPERGSKLMRRHIKKLSK